MCFRFGHIVICLLLLVGKTQLHAQVAQPVKPLVYKKITGSPTQPFAGFLLDKKDTAATLKNYLPLNFYATHLGAACKVELQLEKQTKLPLRIRLGSKDQVDYLEGKFRRN